MSFSLRPISYSRFYIHLKRHWLLYTIWLIGIFVRTYRLDQLLGFYYDQGRDALIVQDILTARNFPAIGPTTGIEGLFLGPFWFYLLTPFYWLSRGNPAIAAGFIATIESFSIPLLYLLLRRYFSASSALLAASIWASSRYLVHSARWFSNPSPLPAFVLLLLYLLAEIYIHKKYHLWWLVAGVLGLSLQLEAASAIFFIPVIVLVFLALCQKKKSFGLKFPLTLAVFLKSFLVFFALLIPQLAFEFKNNFLITKNFLSFLSGKTNTTTGKSWAFPQPDFVLTRLKDYFEIFFSKLDTNTTFISFVFFFLAAIGFIFFLRNRLRIGLYQRQFLFLASLWLFLPLGFLLFFVGNYGRLYDYYLTGLFPAFILVFVILIAQIHIPGLNPGIIPILVFCLFAKANYLHLYNFLIAGVDGPSHVTLGNELQAVKFICSDARPKNVDVYVPAVIPYHYTYLFSWLEKYRTCQLSAINQDLLYTLAEVDPPHPERLDTWLNRQATIATILNQQTFGGIIVQERTRLK